MDLFELEAVELTGINKVIVGHNAFKPGNSADTFHRFCLQSVKL